MHVKIYGRLRVPKCGEVKLSYVTGISHDQFMGDFYKYKLKMTF